MTLFSKAETYNDNIFFRGDAPASGVEKEGDRITAVAGGAAVLLGRQTGNSLAASYNYTRRFFHKRSDQNAGEHTGNFKGNITSGRVNLTSDITFNNNTIPLSGSARVRDVHNSARRVGHTSLNSAFKAKVKLSSKTFVAASGQYILKDDDFKSLWPIASDYDNANIRQEFGFQIRLKIALSAGGIIGRRTADNNTRHSRQPYFGSEFRAEGNFTERITGAASFGVESGIHQASETDSASPHGNPPGKARNGLSTLPAAIGASAIGKPGFTATGRKTYLKACWRSNIKFENGLTPVSPTRCNHFLRPFFRLAP